MTREAILRFVREYYVRENDTPSIRVIAESVPGVNRASFYQHFKDKGELLVALGIEVDESDLPQDAAMEAKKKAMEKGASYHITLNQSQSENLLAIAFMESEPASAVVDELLENYRQVREILLEIDEGRLDAEMIAAILNPNLVYKGHNVSDIAGKPWFMLKCNRCGDDVFISEERTIEWLFYILPAIKRMFLGTTCDDCQPKPISYTRIYAK